MHRFLIVSLALCAACSGSDEELARPTGTVAGEVLDGVTGAPIDAATVDIFTGDDVRSTVTGADGRFLVDDLPSGSELWVDLSKDSYALHRFRVTIDDAAGDEPQYNSVALLDLEMFTNNNRVVVTVESSLGENPGAGVELRIEESSFLSNFELPEIMTATTDANGQATIEGIATFQTYQIEVLPFELGEQVLSRTASYTNERAEDEITLILF